MKFTKLVMNAIFGFCFSQIVVGTVTGNVLQLGLGAAIAILAVWVRTL